jgi:hypothetical protein
MALRMLAPFPAQNRQLRDHRVTARHLSRLISDIARTGSPTHIRDRL